MTDEVAEVQETEDKSTRELLEEPAEESAESETTEEASEEGEVETPTEEASEEEEVPEEEKASESSKIRFSDIKKKYPTLLKEHPELRQKYFKTEQYEEHFPTVEDAAEAAQKAQVFDTLNVEVTSGDFSNLLSAVNNANPKALEKVADTILPNLYQQNQQLYFRAVKPAIAHVLKAALSRAESTKDENLKASVQNIAQFAFGDSRIPQNAQKREEVDPEKEALKAQLGQRYVADAENFQQAVWADSYDSFALEIKNGLDPKNEMNEAMKDYVQEKTLTDINVRLQNDRSFQAEMASLWKRAEQLGFPQELKAKIRNAYLARARTLLPAIRQKRRSEALGISPKPANGKTNIPASAGVPKVASSKLTRQDVREKKMSPMDIILHGAK